MSDIHPQSSKSKDDILSYLARQGQASAQDLANHLRISPQATRRHLKDLETEHLIQHDAVQAGMGRPQYVYQLSEKGRDRLPEQYGDFAVSLLDALAATVGPDQVGSVLKKQWERKALEYQQRVGHGTTEEKVERLVQLRRAEGYMAEWRMLESEDSEPLKKATNLDEPTPNQQFLITEYNCAISDVARSFPTVCGHELEMFALALDGCKVERTHWLVDGEHCCGYLVREQ
ncbi:MAG: iron-sulfur cluster biosynthesis transcriptional regulator SufR [Cyanobacteria bacterium P01_E01_bin.6]